MTSERATCSTEAVLLPGAAGALLAGTLLAGLGADGVALLLFQPVSALCSVIALLALRSLQDQHLSGCVTQSARPHLSPDRYLGAV